MVGRNGAGKTTFLEAMSLVGFGRSFSAAQTKDVVREGSQSARVDATIEYKEQRSLEIRVEKSVKGTKITLNGAAARSASELVQRIPIILLNSKVPDILISTPHSRRVLLDRVLFHVEPSYVQLWRKYRHALGQRNSVIRGAKDRRLAGFWTEQLAQNGQKIDASRREVVDSLNESLNDSILGAEIGVLRLKYLPGWQGLSLGEALERGWKRDLELGHTRVGAHRADIRLIVGRNDVTQRLSRGQLKVVTSEIVLGLGSFIRRKKSVWPVIMVDDIQAELDDRMRSLIVDKILFAGGQKFFTAISSASIPEMFEKVDEVFHVEQKNSISRI